MSIFLNYSEHILKHYRGPLSSLISLTSVIAHSYTADGFPTSKHYLSPSQFLPGSPYFLLRCVHIAPRNQLPYAAFASQGIGFTGSLFPTRQTPPMARPPATELPFTARRHSGAGDPLPARRTTPERPPPPPMTRRDRSVPGYMSRKERKVWTDKLDTWYERKLTLVTHINGCSPAARKFWHKCVTHVNGWSPSRYTTQNFRLFRVYNFVQNLRSFLLM